jgi:hypothetical protein
MYSRRNPWVNLHLLGQHDSLLAYSEAELDAVMAIADKDGDSGWTTPSR